MIIKWRKHEIEILATLRAVTLSVDEDGALTIEDISAWQAAPYEIPEEYIFKPAGEKIAACPPPPPGKPVSPPDPEPDPRASALAARPEKKSDLVKHIERKSGGNGNGAPDLKEKNTPAGERARQALIIGEKIRAWMESKGMKPSEVAKKTGMFHSDISRHLRGLKKPGEKTLSRYAEAFGLADVAELMMRTPERRNSEGKKESAGVPENKNPEIKEFRPLKETGNALPEEKEKKQGINSKGGDRWSKKKKEEEEILDPLVAAVCTACREGGDGNCTGCKVKKGLVFARVHDTPGKITRNAAQSVCIGCVGKMRGTCVVCRMGVYQNAQNLYDIGRSIEEAAREAESDYQAELAARNAKSA